MADDEESAASTFSGLAEEFIAQQRRVAELLGGMAGSGTAAAGAAGPPGPAGPPTPPGLMLPGTLSAAQLASIADNVAAQRRSIETLKTQLAAYDQQLAALQQVLSPLADWARAWAEFEQRLVNMRPGQGGQAGVS